MRILRYLFWILLAVLFVLLLLFAIRNTAPVQLRFFFDQGWDMPLILLLLLFFVIGVVLGLLASLGRIFRQRREILDLRKALASRAVAAGPVDPSRAG